MVNSADGNLLIKPAKLPCPICGKLNANAGTLATHINKHHSSSSCCVEDLSELPFFNEINISNALIDVPRFDRYMENIKKLKDQSRISSFAHKIVNNTNSPTALKSLLTPSSNALDSESGFKTR
jgi:hypothetical protein